MSADSLARRYHSIAASRADLQRAVHTLQQQCDAFGEEMPPSRVALQRTVRPLLQQCDALGTEMTAIEAEIMVLNGNDTKPMEGHRCPQCKGSKTGVAGWWCNCP